MAFKRYVSHNKDSVNYVDDQGDKTRIKIGPSEVFLVLAIIIGAIVTLWAFWVYQRPEGLTIEIFGNEAIVRSYEGTEETIEIPDYYQGVPVTTIGANVFKDNDALMQITLGENITTIQHSAFKGSALETLIIADKSILWFIERKAFDDTPYLALNKSAGFYKIGDVIVDYDEAYFDSHLVIPPDILAIGDNVFAYNDTVETVTFSEGLKVIGSKSFYHMEVLERIEFPTSVDLLEIGDSAFKDSTNLASIDGPVKSSIQRIGSHAFKNTIFRNEQSDEYYQFGNIRVEEPID